MAVAPAANTSRPVTRSVMPGAMLGAAPVSYTHLTLPTSDLV